ncbi:hypothetical protein PV327_010048 [Microctonus hyperodae]|uniref:Uncharacterized protein n=1 Tax=Microctonus hyperodae TaxID=165561 RepID=A0AA39F286_MICHY|nr:hypothetical protein PV327_010048 [Microctonus hyperodae]
MLLNLKTYSNDTTCNESKCVNACDDVSCHQNENCQMINHIPSCECLSNFTRNNEGECLPITTCLDDFTCGSSEFCSNGKCVNACNKICGPNEKCQIFNHNSTCECLGDFIRNNEGECKKRCKTNYECEDSEICHINLCMNTCSPFLRRCPYTQKCEVKNHTVNCLNETSKYKSCTTTTDCDKNSFCTAKESLCIPLCDPPTCPDGERCEIISEVVNPRFTFRSAECRCNFPLLSFGGSLKCFKPCDTDEICEENEYCYFSNWCVPRKHQPLV